MAQLKVKTFKGRYTEYDEVNNPGAVDLLNVDITDKLTKSKGFLLTNEATLSPVTQITISSATASIANVKFYIASADATYSAGDIVGIPYLGLYDANTNIQTISTAISNSYIKIASATTDYISYNYPEGLDYPELITNGSGSSVTGWSVAGTASLTTDGTNFTLTASGGAAYKTAYQTITTEIGKSYTASVDVASCTASTHYIFAGTSSNLLDNIAIKQQDFPTVGNISITFTAIDTTTYIGVSIDAETVFNIVFNNVTCKQSTYTSSATTNVYSGIKGLANFTTDLVKIANVEFQGSYYDKTTDLIYGFLANRDDSKSYLVKSDKDLSQFSFVEASTASSCTDFGTTHKGFFVSYENDIIFTKNEKKQILVGASSTASATVDCGTLYISSGTTILPYGITNNPTGSTLEVFNERIFVGDISYEGSTAVNGGSWIISSKEYPEVIDTEFTASGVAFASNGDIDYCTITMTNHTFKQGQYVYVDNIVCSAGANDINGKLYKVEGITTDTIVIYLESKGHAYTSGGVVLLRGNTWLPTTTLFEPSSTGAGVLRCDDNANDKVVALKKSFTSLMILRERNPYMLSSDNRLTKQLNIDYGTVSKSVSESSTGFLHISEYGLSRVVGTSIQTNANANDNITASLATAPIKTLFDNIEDKSKTLVNFNNDKIWLHDRGSNYTYVLNTLNNEWTIYYGTLADDIMYIDENVYSVYKGMIFKHNTGYTKFDITSMTNKAYSSNYKTALTNFDTDLKKEFKKFTAIVSGVFSDTATALINFNLYYNGSSSIGKTISFDTKTGSDETWLTLATSTEIWTDIASVTDTWEDLVGTPIGTLESGARYLGFGDMMQFEVYQNTANDFSVAEFNLFYNVLDIDIL